MRALHVLARAALRLQSPLEAKATVDRVGRYLTPFAGSEDARTAMAELAPAGTCLSRALAVASRLRGAEVVIGFDPWSSFHPSAHAWIEAEGARIDAGPDRMNAGASSSNVSSSARSSSTGPSTTLWAEIARLPPTGR